MRQFEKVVGRSDCKSITEFAPPATFLKVLSTGLCWLSPWFYLLNARAKELTMLLDRLMLIEFCICLKVSDSVSDSTIMGLLLA